MSDETDNYTPIACALYSEYELAILHRRRLRLHWRDAAGMDHIEFVRPIDLRTREGEEFMVLEDGRELRLDRIVEHRNEKEGEEENR
jgi:Rho-binding antiterminator